MSPILWFLSIGLTVGLLVGQFMKDGKFGKFGDVAIGMIGALISGTVYREICIKAGGDMFDNLVAAAIGALGLVIILRQFQVR